MSEFVESVLDATFAEVAERGLADLTVEAVAARSGTSRATLYRHFPGGRDQLVGDTIRREIDRFLAELVSQAGSIEDPVAHVTGCVVAAVRVVADHALLQRLLVDEADQILPPLAVVHPLVHATIVGHLALVFERARDNGLLEPGVDVPAAADHCARVLLSYVENPGEVDIADPLRAERVVRTRILAGVVTGVTGR